MCVCVWMMICRGRLLNNISMESWTWFRSLHAFLTLLFVCCCLCYHYKLWLWSIQIHARDCFQEFAYSHLKRLCSSIGIWADNLFLDRYSIWISWHAEMFQDVLVNSWKFHMHQIQNRCHCQQRGPMSILSVCISNCWQVRATCLTSAQLPVS